MTTEKKVARRKLSLLELAADLGNVSKACRVMGYSRQQFYEIRRNFQTYGADGLLDKIAGARPPHPNRVAEAVEQAILDHGLAHPCHGVLRVANELALHGIQVSSTGVRGVWSRHGLLSRHNRLLRLEKASAERTAQLSDEQLTLISRKSPLAEAIRYALSRWQGLNRFLDDGRVETDSNVVERAIRPIAPGRKNHLFAGSDGGGQHWAVLASLIATCKLNDVDPNAYLADVLAKIVARHPVSRIDELLPFAYVKPKTSRLHAA